MPVVIQEVVQEVHIDDGQTTTIVEVLDQRVSVVTVGTQGPAGATLDSSDKYFSLAFNNTSSVVVNHNLSKYPAVAVLDSAHDQVEGTVSHTSLNSLTVTFSAPFSGVVTCN